MDVGVWGCAAASIPANNANSRAAPISLLLLFIIIRDFRFGPLTRPSYAPPALDTTNLPPEQPPVRWAGCQLPNHVSALSEARFHEYVKVGTMLCARSIN